MSVTFLKVSRGVVGSSPEDTGSMIDDLGPIWRLIINTSAVGLVRRLF